MGTNFYHRTNICDHCNRYDEHHIGKSSGGWTFSFHGEREIDPEMNPLNEMITSFSDWKTRLKDSKIFNEYDEEISLTEFLQLVEDKRDEKNNQTTYCRIEHPDYAKNCWLDDEGNSFSEGEFSQMASKKKLTKIANEGGYNFLHNNPHLQRKKVKAKLKQIQKQDGQADG